ncbi:MAG: permease, partial [Heliobacteriaceae bacterium]|nr:permease [Heliobacteriaceae bacterium]
MHFNDLITSLKYFVTISVELIILFVVISFLVGLIQEFIPDEKIRAVLQRPRRIIGNILGAAFGSLTPFCSCSTIPVLVGLLNAGAPFGASMSFLFTSPLLNPIIVGLFLTLFGWKITLIYSVLVFTLAVFAGMVLERLGFASEVKNLSLVSTRTCCAPAAGSCCAPAPSGPVMIDLTTIALDDPAAENPPVWRQRVAGAYQKSKVLFLQVFPYLLVGAGIGALIYGFMPQDLLGRVAGPDNFFAVPIAAVIGIPMYIRA